MYGLNSLALSVAISLLVSTAVLFALLRPLQRLLAMLCKSGEALPFWQRFTIVMLYAVPLFFAVLWAPYREDLTSIVRLALAASLFGTIGGLSIIGLKVASARSS